MKYTHITIGLALAVIITCIGIPSAALAQEELSKQERVQKVREALRERRAQLRQAGQERSEILENEEQQLFTEHQSTLLSLIATRYRNTYTRLETIGQKLQDHLTEDQAVRYTTLQEAQIALQTADEHITTMESISREDIDTAGMSSEELTDRYKDEAFRAKAALKEVNAQYVDIIQSIRSEN